MSSSRHDLSEQAIHLIAERFKALSEPTRLRLIMALQEGEKNVGSLVKETGATQANVSRQLQNLTDAGILKRRKEGVHVFYSIADPEVFDLCKVVCGSLEDHFKSQAEAFNAGRRRPRRKSGGRFPSGHQERKNPD